MFPRNIQQLTFLQYQIIKMKIYESACDANYCIKSKLPSIGQKELLQSTFEQSFKHPFVAGFDLLFGNKITNL